MQRQERGDQYIREILAVSSKDWGDDKSGEIWTAQDSDPRVHPRRYLKCRSVSHLQRLHKNAPLLSPGSIPFPVSHKKCPLSTGMGGQVPPESALSPCSTIQANHSRNFLRDGTLPWCLTSPSTTRIGVINVLTESAFSSHVRSASSISGDQSLAIPSTSSMSSG